MSRARNETWAVASWPGARAMVAGVTDAASASSGSSTRRVRAAGTLPPLTNRTLDRAEPLLSTVWGTSVAPTSVKGATSTTPSSTTEKPGSSCDRTRTPNGLGPAVTAVERGGENRTSTVPWAPGYRFSVGGVTVTQAVVSPTTSMAKTSTTLPSLRTRTEAVADEPGVTLIRSGLSTTDAPIGGC